MYKDTYSEPTQISIVQILMIIGIVFVFAIVPIKFIDQQRISQQEETPSPYTASAIAAREAEQGRVAGAATSIDDNIIFIPLVNRSLDLKSEASLLTIGGMLLIGISIIAVTLMLKPAKQNHIRKELDDFEDLLSDIDL